VLGHSDRCWMPQFPAGDGGPQAEGGDYRTNVFVPAGMEAAPEADAYETVTPGNGKKTFCTFGKERRDHTVLVANVKPYLKAKRALSPLLQESSSSTSSGSPTKGCSSSSSASSPSCATVKSPADGAEGKPAPPPCSSGHYGPPDGRYLSPAKPGRDQGGPGGGVVYPAPPSGDPVAKVLAEARSRISQGAEPERGRDPAADPELAPVGGAGRDIDQLLQDCRGGGGEAGGTLRK